MRITAPIAAAAAVGVHVMHEGHAWWSLDLEGHTSTAHNETCSACCVRWARSASMSREALAWGAGWRPVRKCMRIYAESPGWGVGSLCHVDVGTVPLPQ